MIIIFDISFTSVIKLRKSKRHTDNLCFQAKMDKINAFPCNHSFPNMKVELYGASCLCLMYNFFRSLLTLLWTTVLGAG